MTDPILLVTNDDGYDAPGLQALADVLADIGNIWVVAPDRQQSASSHALTLHKPLRVNSVDSQRFTVSGTPTDCVYLGVRTILKQPPTMVVSGINHGANLGDDVSYSGTVSAALEGALMGAQAVAVSRLHGPATMSWEEAAQVAKSIIVPLLGAPMPTRSYVNINIPGIPLCDVRGVQTTVLGQRHYSQEIVTNTDPRGRPYYWIGGEEITHATIEGTDCTAVDDGWVSVTPLTARWDLTGGVGILEDVGIKGKPWSL